MAIGSGLSAQLGIKAESVWGTPVTVDKFYELMSSSLVWTPTWVEGQGLRAGATFKRDGRTQQTRTTVEGDIGMEMVTKGGMGLLFKHALGSGITTPTQIALTTAYKQHHFPLTKQALGLTIQVGKPEPGGTVQPHTYEGCKITSWEFSVSDGEKAQISFTFDGQDELTATGLAVASYPASLETFTFKDSNLFQIAGTTSIVSNEFSWGGSPVTPSAIVRSFTIRGETPLANERYGLGNSGIKAEQIENDIPTITGTLEAEYVRADYYTIFKAGTSTGMKVRLQHGDAGSANPYELSFTMPKVKFKNVPTPVDGPDILTSSVEFEAYHDDTLTTLSGVNAGASTALEVRLVSTDTTLAG